MSERAGEPSVPSESGVAARLAGLFERRVGAPLPVRLRAWDGSEAGPADGPTVVLRQRRALRRLLWSPGELGLARAFVSGDLDAEGDVTEGLSRFHRLATTISAGPGRTPWREALATALRVGVLGPPPRPPAAEARLSGRLHTRRRDRAAIAHHYDLSNDFYRLLLDPAMAYSCAYWATEPDTDPGYGLAEAQRDKLDLVCRKLALRPGMRLLDVGCGWAALAIHAATHYGAHVVGVTLSAAQREFGAARVAELGLADRVELRVQDYRSIPDPPFDAVSSLEMGEHVGDENYPEYAATLHRMLRPGARLLLQQMSRGAAGGDAHPGGGAFIERYVAPDMSMRPVGATIGMLEAAGLELVDVQSLREHYVWTVRPWLDTLRARRTEVERLVGPEQYRVWLLYLAGSALAFEQNRMGVHQVLAVRSHPDGRSGLPGERGQLLGDGIRLVGEAAG